MTTRSGFTERLAVASARRPWLVIGIWLVVLAVSAFVYFAYGDVFTSSSKFLNHPDSRVAVDLIEKHGRGSAGAELGSAVRRLADGIDAAGRGAHDLAVGSGKVKKGAKALDRGLGKLSAGAGTLSSGAARTSAGVSGLSGGLAEASRGAVSLSSGLGVMTDATGGLSVGLAKLSRGGSRLATAAAKLQSGAAGVAGGAAPVAAGVKDAAGAAAQLSGGAAGLSTLVEAYLAAHPEAAHDPTFAQIVAVSGHLAAGTSSLAAGLQSASEGSAAVAAGAAKVASGTADLAGGARDLSGGLARSASGAARIDRTMGVLAAGGSGLARGVGTAASGSSRLAAGSSGVAAGSSRLAAAAGAAAGGAGQLADGAGRLADGVRGLSDGLDSTSAGAGELADAVTSAGSLTNRDTELVVIRHDRLTVDDPAFKTNVVSVRDGLTALPDDDVAAVVSAYDRGLDPRIRAALKSKDGHSTILKVEMASTPDEATNHMKGVFDIVVAADGRDGFQAAVTGVGAFGRDAHALARHDLVRGELLGVPVALLILIVVFGALVAAGLPVVLGVFAMVVGLALTVLIGHGFELSIFALNILTATALAVGIDYSLFIVSRYREERHAGRDKDEAIRVAAATASNAVFFSGMTVVFSLIGMLIVPLSIFASLGIGAMTAVFAAVAGALTLLPAMLTLLGDRIDALPVPWLGRRARRPSGEGWWGRSARRTMRHPALYLALGAALLLAIAAPALTMHRGGLSASSFPDTYTSREGLDMLRRDFAAGMSEPVKVVIEGDIASARVQEAVRDFVDRVQQDERFTVTGVKTSADGELALVELVQDAESMEPRARDNIRSLRDTIVPDIFDDTGARVYVGGTVAADIDSVTLTDGYLPIVVAIVLSLSFVLLLVAFRSLVLAASAIVMNLLSVGAAYGALTLVFERGIGAGLLGVTQVETIEAWIPLLMFCVLFGLSMDYQVFLLSRIRERWQATGDTGGAVVFGVQSTAGIITGAALIMVAVFVGMGSGEMIVLQELGLGLAVAILLDAFIVRVVVAPATIALLGDHFWWMPSWLGWLPRIHIEGPAVYRSTP